MSNCLQDHNGFMLYVGIAPDKPGKRISRQTIRSRVRYHLQGNAEGSTLRRTLGVLLAEKSGFPLRRVGSGHRMTLTHLGEQWPDDWLERSASVCWRPHDEPWELKKRKLLGRFLVPSTSGAMTTMFSALRYAKFVRMPSQMRRLMPVAYEGNQARRSIKGIQ